MTQTIIKLGVAESVPDQILTPLIGTDVYEMHPDAVRLLTDMIVVGSRAEGYTPGEVVQLREELAARVRNGSRVIDRREGHMAVTGLIMITQERANIYGENHGRTRSAMALQQLVFRALAVRPIQAHLTLAAA